MAEKQKDGSYRVHVSFSNHKYHTGKYTIHTYLTDGNGLTSLVGGPKAEIKEVQAKTKVEDIKGNEKEYRVTVSNTGVFGDIKNVRFAVWSEENGQDDIQWINGIAGANGSWSSKVIISQFKSYGTYYIHIFGTLSNGNDVFLGNTDFTISKPRWNVEIENQDDEAGTFDIVIKDIESKSGVSQIQVPVWCAEDQNDIQWYVAEKQKDGSYRVHVSIANHKYHYGEYKIHTYLTDGNGLTILKGINDLKIQKP